MCVGIDEKVFKVKGQRLGSYQGEMHLAGRGIPVILQPSVHYLCSGGMPVVSVELRLTCFISFCRCSLVAVFFCDLVMSTVVLV